MNKEIHEKLDEILKAIHEQAKDDFESGHPLDSNDFKEFQQILDEDNLNINHLLFKYYYECFENIHE